MIAVLSAIVLGAPQARAQCAQEWRYDRDTCQCICEGIPVFPPSGSVLPTNFVIRVRGLYAFSLQRGDEMLDVDVTHRDVAERLEWMELRVVNSLAPGEQIDLWTPQANPPLLLASWTVGDEEDHTPPQWEGEYHVETVNDREDDCGFAEHSHYVTWEGLTEDSAGGAVFAYAHGLGEFIDPEYGDERGFDARWDACGIDDLSLYDPFHRSYRVAIEDAAGNSTGYFDVRTGREVLGCGCGGPSKKEYEDKFPPDLDDVVSASGATRPLVAAPLLLWALRRRRGDSRSGGPPAGRGSTPR